MRRALQQWSSLSRRLSVHRRCMATEKAEVVGSASSEGRSLDPLERARSLLETRISGTFSTVTAGAGGCSGSGEPKQPPLWGGIMPYVLAGHTPVLGLRETEQHAVNLKVLPNASLMVFSLTPKEHNPVHFPLPRVNLAGEVDLIKEEKQIFLTKQLIHPGSRDYLEEFDFYQFTPKAVVISKNSDISGLKVYKQEEFQAAPIDPLASSVRALQDVVNKKFHKELKEVCKQHGGEEVEEAFLFHADRFGFEALGRSKTLTPDGREQWTEFRFPFSEELTDKDAVLAAILEASKGNA